MPLRKGRTWRYIMHQAAEVVEVKCTTEERVGDSDGWRLEGLAGTSVMAWDGCVLRASRMGSMAFDPPIGLLQSDKERASWDYRGAVTARLRHSAVVAKLNQEPVESENGDRLRVTLTVDLNGNEIDLVTTFSRGVGIVEQHQRNKGKVVSSVKLLNDRG